MPTNNLETPSTSSKTPLSLPTKVIFTSIIILVALLASEVVIRVWIHKVHNKSTSEIRGDYYNVMKQGPSARTNRIHYDPGIFQGHPYLPFVLRPNIKHTWVKKFPLLKAPIPVEIVTNSFGLRGPEISLRRPKGAYRILCLGGSTTFGVVAEKDCWPRQLEGMLRQAHPNVKVEVINAGVPSYTSAESLVSFSLRWVELQPNAVIVHHMINDLAVAQSTPFLADYSHTRKDFPSEPKPLDYFPAVFEKSAIFCYARWKLYPDRHNDITGLITRPHKPGYSPFGIPTFIRNMRELIVLAKSMGMETVISTMHYVPKHPAANMSKENRVPLERNEAWNQAIRDLAREEPGVLLVDQFELIPDETQLHVDGFHMNVTGETWMAKNYFDAIEKSGWIEDYASHLADTPPANQPTIRP